MRVPRSEDCAATTRTAQVKLVLQKLAGVNSTPMIALNEAAELLCKHLSVSFCR
jgi:DNA-directed RNA polymerase alpha subunit